MKTMLLWVIIVRRRPGEILPCWRSPDLWEPRPATMSLGNTMPSCDIVKEPPTNYNVIWEPPTSYNVDWEHRAKLQCRLGTQCQPAISSDM